MGILFTNIYYLNMSSSLAERYKPLPDDKLNKPTSYEEEKLTSKENFKYARCHGKMRDYYRILDPPLGEGAYGETWKVCWKDKKNLRSAVKEYRACKILRK